MRLFQLMYHCYAIWCLRCTVNHLRTAVSELVGFHYSHPGPVRVIDIVLKQADAKWVWDHSTSVDYCSPNKNVEKLIYYNTKNINT